ncbi:unnamed protein product [Spirodela intermedia]|uniref:NAD(+) kinase n=1 Tax=Spirodela intermedia TaxID=51605 RepID=A0A7I8JC61_SPIIN|nr:unnamed protein product [Spirodela intermedia]CAA6667710.1 unnamed protein product [Spirodela intermedia]
MSRVASGLGASAPLGLCFLYGGKKFDLSWDARRCYVNKEARRRRRGRGGGSNAPRIVAARASLSSFFSTQFRFDSQTFQTQDLSQQLRIGPIPGDIAEVEAYCRIFRASEQLHGAIMESLCNPETGECKISYNIPSEELPSVEEKIVAVLGCMVVLLNRVREEVLSGRSSLSTSFRVKDVNTLDGRVPPLAVFRGEMKRFCESLHLALANYFTPFDDRSSNIWRKLQRLKNVCYDAGFSRFESYPCQTMFANWNPVYLSTAKEGTTSENREVAFWKGGQVTDEALHWLMENGFKTIVDLRVEYVNDKYYQLAIDSAISCGKIHVVHMPVEVGTAPSMEQIEQFASLVSDSTKRPLYLHSQEGIGRTSAMVSRWRQYTTRSGSQLTNANSPPGDKNNQLPEDLDNPRKFHGMNGKGGNGAILQDHQNEGKVHRNSVSVDEADPQFSFSMDIDPLKCQVPNFDVFSRKAMMQFLKDRKVSPRSYINKQIKRFDVSAQSGYQQTVSNQVSETPSEIQPPSSLEIENSNGKLPEKDFRPRMNGENDAVGDKSFRNENTVSSGSNVNGFRVGESRIITEPKITIKNENLNKQVSSNAIGEKRGDYGRPEGGSEVVDGNMCASATGVVRIQSRRKAEMFLVRTDGFSCTREKVQETSLAFTHPSTQQQMLMWKSTPKTVLLLKKYGKELMEEAKQVASFLYHQGRMNVVVEPDVHDAFARIPGFGFIQTFYSQDTSDLHERVDFVTCLGGDGVILHASNLFRGAVPPVVSFNLGSLGFLTSHAFDDFREDLSAVIHGNNTLDGVYITFESVPGKIFDVLNEIVVDRGSNPYLSKIECYEHNRLITKVQGDGVIIATPTGSTAYSTSAGGSMVHPNVPCILFTPICPHSLSFRPVILPDSAQLELKIPADARSNAWVSFDGKRRQQLSRGDSVRICMSQHPLPTVNKSDQTGDWFHSLIRCLNWNERMDQKAL